MAKSKVKEKLEKLLKQLEMDVKSNKGDPGGLGKRIQAEAKTAAGEVKKVLGSEDD